MFRTLSHIGITAIHEFRDAIRSRRALIILFLYIGLSVFACYWFIYFLEKLGVMFTELLMLPETVQPGAVIERVMNTTSYRKMIEGMFEQPTLVDDMVTVHPVAIFFSYYSRHVGALLVMLIAAPRVAEEVASGSARFTLYRTSRLAWVIGKYWGQALLLVPALVLSAIGVWILAMIKFQGHFPVEAVGYMVQFGFRASLYILAWLGVALGVSQLTRSSELATALAFITAILFVALDFVASYYVGSGVAQLWDSVRQFLPLVYQTELWWLNDIVRVAAAGFMLLLLGHLYVIIGNLVTRSRDQ